MDKNHNIWFTSDTHFWHKNIILYTNRPWASVEEMNQGLIERWNSVVNPEDEVYHAGDFCFGSKKKWLEILEQLNGKIHLIQGNHDHNARKPEVKEKFVWVRPYYELYVPDEDAANGKTQMIVLCHYPMLVWNQGHKNSWMLHGHSHSSLDKRNKSTTRLDIGLDAEHSDFHLLSYEKVKSIMKTRQYVPQDHHNEGTNP